MPSTLQVTDGRQLAYAEWGDLDGSPIFALHGTPGCRLDRPPGEDKLRAAGLHLITYDRPGYGASDRHNGRQVADCVGDVALIADAVGVERFAIIGTSGGGPHALAVCARLGDRVTNASCVVGIAPYDSEGLDWLAGMDPENVEEFGWALSGKARLTVELDREAAALLARVAQDPASILEGFQLPTTDIAVLADPRVQQIIRESAAEMFVNGVSGWVDDDLAFTTPWGFDPSEIDLPVEICFGSSDVLVPPAHGHWLASHIAGARTVVETDKGHLEGPDEMIEHLRRLVHG
ncbi:MAG TPA: alpha/beta hydrolase [Acidimicrobiales bacterium]|nr:alpha/beta hydrolase [Acidimicrobiales bacterium]